MLLFSADVGSSPQALRKVSRASPARVPRTLEKVLLMTVVCSMCLRRQFMSHEHCCVSRRYAGTVPIRRHGILGARWHLACEPFRKVLRIHLTTDDNAFYGKRFVQWRTFGGRLCNRNLVISLPSFLQSLLDKGCELSGADTRKMVFVYIKGVAIFLHSTPIARAEQRCWVQHMDSVTR